VLKVLPKIITIGRAVPGCEVYILNEELQLVPVGYRLRKSAAVVLLSAWAY